MARYNEEIQRAIEGVSAWNAGCNGYYRSPSGRIVTQWPYSMSEFQARTAEPEADAFETAPAAREGDRSSRPPSTAPHEIDYSPAISSRRPFAEKIG